MPKILRVVGCSYGKANICIGRPKVTCATNATLAGQLSIPVVAATPELYSHEYQPLPAVWRRCQLKFEQGWLNLSHGRTHQWQYR